MNLIEALEGLEKYGQSSQSIYEKVDKEALENDELIFQLIKHDQTFVNTFKDRLLKSETLMQKVFDNLDSSIYHRFKPELKNDREFMIKLLEVDPNAAYNIGEELKNDVDFMKKAVKINEEVGYNAPKEIKEQLTDSINFKKNLKEMLGAEKYKIVAYYPETQKAFEEISDQGNIQPLKECIKKLNEQNLDMTEWTRGMEKITENYLSGDYKELLSNIDIEKTDLNKLYNIMQKDNYYNIKNNEELENYEQIKEQVCTAIVSGDKTALKEYEKINKMTELEQKQFAVFQKHFNLDLEEAKLISEKCFDIIELQEKNINPELKQRVETIATILKTQDETMLEKMYNSGKTNLKEKNAIEILTEAKKCVAKEFNETLFNPKQGEKIEKSYLVETLKMTEENANKCINENIEFINAGTEFNMLITSVGAYGNGANQKSNCYENWNRELTNGYGVSCSYIGNDMRGTASIQNLCYGFSDMDESALLMQGTVNLGTTTDKEKLTVKSSTRYEEYYTPEDMKTYTNQHNEMLYSRMQNGERKQPDFVIVFKEKEKIIGLEGALAAVKDFKNQGIDIPVVVVDNDKCVENEKEKLNKMIKEYKTTRNAELGNEIETKIKRNRVTNNREFTEYSVEYSVARETPEKTIQIEDYENAYEKTTAEERKQETTKIVALNKELIREVENEKEM